MARVHGLHHVTAIAGDAQENLDFYAGILGMRLVKRSVNQDDPSTYHLFYADAEGSPGSDLTFFPWPHMAPVQQGVGLVNEVALAVPSGSHGYWAERLAHYGIRLGEPATRFGERVMPVTDPHGLALTLVETSDEREFAPWTRSPVPEEHQIRGLHAVRLRERDLATTSRFLTEVMGFAATGEEDGWHRFGVEGGGSGRHLEILELPRAQRGRWGTGGVHHVAWRVEDVEEEMELQRAVREAGRRPTEVIDRFWFNSVYFLEPGGVLFELATEGPGFAIDEDASTLGEQLILPPWLEPQRAQIEAGLPPLTMPAAAPVR